VNKPNKGFIRELSRGTQPRKVETKAFTYAKAVTPETKVTTSLATPHRLREFKSAKEPKSNIKQEYSQIQKKRRGEDV